jgi:NAD(P)-dependent dehydrogenase (short-subunit alcohol dehydrogenase family)
MTDVTQRIAVTGAAGGAGLALVEAFLEAGAQIAAVTHTDRLPPRFIAEGVKEYRCDIRDRSSVVDTFDAIAIDLGGLDALVHTAAVESYCSADSLREDDVSFVLDVNVKGTIWTNQAAFTHLGSGGSITNFVSIAGIRGIPGMAHYAASKAAVGAWTRCAATEWGSRGVRVNAVAPVMMTRMAQAYRSNMSETELDAYRESLKDIIHIDGEFGDPLRDIAPVVQFLTSSGARFITGQTISIDGGWMKLGS